MHSYYHLDSLVHSYFFVGICLAFIELFLLGLVEDRIIEVGVSSYKF
jgi:hypothetical protein